jgi:hypothetical protein
MRNHVSRQYKEHSDGGLTEYADIGIPEWVQMPKIGENGPRVFPKMLRKYGQRSQKAHHIKI